MTPIARHVGHEPIVAKRGTTPPEWVVSCLDCGFSVDAHGVDGEEAVRAVAPSHDRRHTLLAVAMDYTTGYGPEGTDPHPLYTT